MMKKAISFLTSLALCLTPLAGTVSNTVAADDTAVIAEKEAKHCEICGEELPDDALPSPLGLYICSDCRGQGMGGTTTGTVPSTTTSTTSTVATTTTTFKGICDEYDFEGYLFLEGWEYSHTQGDELDLGELRFTLNILDSSEENTRGFVNTRFFWSEDHSDQKLSDFYDIDTSKVDMDTPGVYPIYITMKEDKIGYFYLFENDSTSRLGVRESNDYKIKMVEHTQERNVMVMERYTGTTTTTTTTTTTPTTTITVDTNAPFYFNPGYLEFEGINGFLMSFYFNNKDDVEVEFSSSDESVAYFEYEGYSADNPMVTFCGYGETTLTATAKDGTTASMVISVVPLKSITTTTACETTTTTMTETTALIDPIYDFPIDVHIEDDIVIAIDDNAIIFKDNGRYGIQDTSRPYLSDIKVGMRISCHFSYMYSPNPPVILYVIEKEILESKADIEPTMAGDVNCDDQVNMADAVLIMQCIANPDKYGIGLTTGINCVGAKNADVDGSGDVTNNDALTIQRFKLKLIDSLT